MKSPAPVRHTRSAPRGLGADFSGQELRVSTTSEDREELLTRLLAVVGARDKDKEREGRKRGREGDSSI